MAEAKSVVYGIEEAARWALCSELVRVTATQHERYASNKPYSVWRNRLGRYPLILPNRNSQSPRGTTFFRCVDETPYSTLSITNLYMP